MVTTILSGTGPTHGKSTSGDRVLSNSSILGVQIGHNSGCAVYFDGHIHFCVSEERFSKRKNEPNFPAEAIDAAYRYMAANGIPFPDAAVIPTLSADYTIYMVSREARFSVDDYLREQREYYYPRMYRNEDASYPVVFPEKYDETLLASEDLNALKAASDPRLEWRHVRERMVRRATGIEDVSCINHEYTHGAYGFFAGETIDQDALVVAIDGFGDDANCSVWTHEDGALVCQRRYKDFNIGRLYRYMTLLLGMKPSEHEYKVMGLAPYASGDYVERSYEVFRSTMDFIDGEVIYLERPTDYYHYFRDRLEGHRFDCIAGGLQRYCEEMIAKVVQYWSRRTSKSHVVLTGGVALNIKANMAVAALPEVQNLSVPPSGGDESLAMGAIFSYLNEQRRTDEIQAIGNFYLGTEYDQEAIDADIRQFLSCNNDFAAFWDVSTSIVASLLAQNFIVGRFVGRMEFGARALGNRSILANPSEFENLKKINQKIKQRDFWMPFTPSLLDSAATRYLVNDKGNSFPHMTIACETTDEGRKDLIAALHPSDLTARPQVVRQDVNPEYWDLLNEFHDITGIGGLLNTSLNLSGLPVCESPADVFNVMKNSDLDMVVMGTTLLVRARHIDSAEAICCA